MVLVLLIYIFSARLVAWGKLHPDIFEFAAKAMNVPAAQCLVLEASVAGVTAAVFAKMKCIGLTGGSYCQAGHANCLHAAGTF